MTAPTLSERAAVMASQFINGCDDGMDPNDVASLLLEQAQEIARLESQLAGLAKPAPTGFGDAR